MIVTIHQPNHLPYLGFFEKMANSDIIILYDNTQFKSDDWQNRNKIRTKDGGIWLTVPLKYKFGENINQVKIDNTKNWSKKHWRSIQANYAKAPHFKEYKGIFEKIYSKEWNKLFDLNIALIKEATKILGLKTKIIVCSELMDLRSKGPEALLEMLKKVEATKYISGADGKKYLDLKPFKEANIEVIFQDYKHPEYNQTFPGFEPNMCILDLIFNHGPESLKILKKES